MYRRQKGQLMRFAAAILPLVVAATPGSVGANPDIHLAKVVTLRFTTGAHLVAGAVLTLCVFAARAALSRPKSCSDGLRAGHLASTNEAAAKKRTAEQMGSPRHEAFPEADRSRKGLLASRATALQPRPAVA
jgi:hypothetical protein